MPNLSNDPVASLPSGFTLDVSPQSTAAPQNGANIFNAFDPTQSIIDAANLHGVDPDFALKIAHQESGINPNVKDSSAGAIGVMQLMPATAKQLGVDPRDPSQNIDGGVRYLAQLQKQFNGDRTLTAAAYNAGPTRVQNVLAGKATLPPETVNYINSVANSPISAKALGYTSPAPANNTVQAFANNLDNEKIPPLPDGFVLEGEEQTPPLPDGFVLEGSQQPTAPAQSTQPQTDSSPAAQPPGGKSWTDRVQAVWDNPTPGGLVSIIKGIYTGLKSGAEATQAAAYGDMGSDVTDKAVKAAVNLAPLVGGGAIPPAASTTTKSAADAAADAAVAAAERLRITIPRYMATDGATLPALAQGAKAVPWAGKPIYQSAADVKQSLQDVINLIAPQTASDVAGAAAKDALTQNIKVDAPAEVSALYGKLEGGPNGGGSLTDQNVRVPLSNTMQKMQELQAGRVNANLPEWSPSMKILAQAVTDPKGMNYAGIKQLRSYLGQGAPQTLIAEGINPQEARQLYGPLTEDLKNAVFLGGGQKALDDFTEANALAAANATQRKQLYKIIGAKGDVAPEAVFSRLAQLASTKSTADIALLQQAKTAMGTQAWSQVGNAIISRLGRDAQGNFSADRFIGPNGYPSLSPAAKSILFTPQQKSSLDDLTTVSNQVSAKLSKFQNTSKTAPTLEAASLLGGLAHPVGTIATLAGARAAATLLARPAVSRAAANLGRVQLMGATPNAIIARRAALAAAIRAELSTTAGQ